MEPRDKWQYPGSKPSEGTQIVVSYNQAWLPIVSGVLFHLAHKALWDGAPDDILEEISDLQYHLESPVNIPEFPSHQFFMPPMMSNQHGSALQANIASSSLFNGYWDRVTPAQNDELYCQFPLSQGNYVLEYHYVKASGQGKVTLRMPEVSVGVDIDQYNGTTQQNQVFTQTFTVTNSMLVTLDMKVESKNPSSVGYQQAWRYIVIRPG